MPRPEGLQTGQCIAMELLTRANCECLKAWPVHMNRVYTIWKTNIAMQNSPFTGDVPVEHNACTTGMPEPLVILRLLKDHQQW